MLMVWVWFPTWPLLTTLARRGMSALLLLSSGLTETTLAGVWTYSPSAFTGMRGARFALFHLAGVKWLLSKSFSSN